MTEINYKEKIKQIDVKLKQWSKRKLTLFGRITVLKILIISKLNHLFIALPDPKNEITKKKKKFTLFGSQEQIELKENY